jgi:hypothetical protein
MPGTADGPAQTSVGSEIICSAKKLGGHLLFSFGFSRKYLPPNEALPETSEWICRE